VLQTHAGTVATTENLGYMSGALKDFFDRSFYDLVDHTDAMPYAMFIRAGKDGTGTRRAIESICGGLNWKPVQQPLICRGDWDEAFLDQCRELGLTMAAGLEAGIL
jgi:multimeric flavodoxin WrbA